MGEGNGHIKPWLKKVMPHPIIHGPLMNDQQTRRRKTMPDLCKSSNMQILDNGETCEVCNGLVKKDPQPELSDMDSTDKVILTAIDEYYDHLEPKAYYCSCENSGAVTQDRQCESCMQPIYKGTTKTVRVDDQFGPEYYQALEDYINAINNG